MARSEVENSFRGIEWNIFRDTNWHDVCPF